MTTILSLTERLAMMVFYVIVTLTHVAWRKDHADFDMFHSVLTLDPSFPLLAETFHAECLASTTLSSSLNVRNLIAFCYRTLVSK
jgi:hypothetical protein